MHRNIPRALKKGNALVSANLQLSLSLDDFEFVCRKNQGDIARVFTDAFALGFLQGMKAQKNSLSAQQRQQRAVRKKHNFSITQNYKTVKEDFAK